MASLFIYGTLQDADVCEAVLGRTVAQGDITPAEAPGFAIYQVANTSYPCLLPATGQIAKGALLSNLTADDLALLDQFEGVNYARTLLDVMVAGTCVTTDYYQPQNNLETDGGWDFARWLATGKQTFLARDFNLNGVRKPSDD